MDALHGIDWLSTLHRFALFFCRFLKVVDEVLVVSSARIEHPIMVMPSAQTRSRTRALSDWEEQR